jgi:hypothetical protein
MNISLRNPLLNLKGQTVKGASRAKVQHEMLLYFRQISRLSLRFKAEIGCNQFRGRRIDLVPVFEESHDFRKWQLVNFSERPSSSIHQAAVDFSEVYRAA